MTSSDDLKEECKKTSISLERTAKRLSSIYAICIWLAVIIGILMIGGVIKNSLINFMVGGMGLLFTLIPLILKDKIEKIEGYHFLSMEFKNLEQDFITNINYPKSLSKLKTLRKKLSKYPIRKKLS